MNRQLIDYYEAVHSENGVESLALLVQLYSDHLHHHLKVIREKRAMVNTGRRP